MLARCVRCQNTFTTDRFGVQTCPHCGSEILLSDPNAPAPPPASGVPPPAPAPGALPPASGSGGPPSGPPPPPTWGAPPPPPPPWGATPSAPPPPWGAPPPPPPPTDQAAPFAQRAGLGWFSAFAQTWKLAVIEPQRFFRAVRVDQPGWAVLFAIVSVTVSQWFQAAYGYLAGISMEGWLEPMLRAMPQGQRSFDPQFLRFALGASLAALVARVVLAPLYALLMVYLLAGVVHLFLMVLRGTGRGFGATLTAVGYASGVQLIGAIPACGAVIAPLWFLVLAIIAIGEAQRCGPGKATAAVLLPGVLACVLCCGSIAALTAVLGGALRNQGGVTL